MRLPLALKLNYHFARDERGTQLVELALVLPLVMILFGGIAEFGNFFQTYSTLSKATRAGARYLISQPVGSKDGAGRNMVVYGNAAGSGAPVIEGLTTGNVQITYTRTGATTQTATVAIQGFTYTPLFDIGKLIKRPEVSLRVNVGAGSTMRQLVQ